MSDALPAPLTSRTLRSRSQAIKSRSVSVLSRSSRGSSLSSQGVNPMAEPAVAAADGPSRGVKRRLSTQPTEEDSIRSVVRNGKRREVLTPEPDAEGEAQEELFVIPQAGGELEDGNGRGSGTGYETHTSPSAPVSSPSLAKNLNPPNLERTTPPTSTASSPIEIIESTSSAFPSTSQTASSSARAPLASSSSASRPPAAQAKPAPVSHPEPDLLSAYTCPICFSPPTNATLTPCGHICCGSCLFMAVKTMTQRTQHGFGAPVSDAAGPRCPVCRALIPGWDGKGGGVIGLKVRAMFTL